MRHTLGRVAGWLALCLSALLALPMPLLQAQNSIFIPNIPTFPLSFTVGDLLYAAGTNTIGSIADVAVGQVLVSGGVGVSPAYSATPTVTSVTSTQTALAAGPATAPAPGFLAQNTTPATVGTVAQYSGTIGIKGSGWDVDDAVARNVDCYQVLRPVSANTVSSEWQLLCQLAAAGYTNPFKVSSGGQMTLTGAAVIGQTSALAWNGRSAIVSGGNGTMSLSNNAGDGFTSLNIVGDVIFNASAASISSGCGTTPSAPVGNASAFQVTVGAGGDTACVLTFATSFTNTPHCVANDRSTANLMRVSVAATTGITVAGVMVAGDVIDVLCLGHWQ